MTAKNGFGYFVFGDLRNERFSKPLILLHFQVHLPILDFAKNTISENHYVIV
jgi:hypothetical protein